MEKNVKIIIFENKLLLFIFILALLPIIAIFFPYDLFDGIKVFGFFTIKTKPYNELGSFIAGITAPCSSLSAFILIFMTYRSQRIQYVESTKLITIQMFDSMFFHIINLNNEIKNNIRIVCEGKLYQGGDAINYFKEYITKEFEKRQGVNVSNTPEEELKRNCINDALLRYNSTFKQYYEYIKFITKKIKTNNAIVEKDGYFNILETQLSLDELHILRYLPDDSDDASQFKELIEKFILNRNNNSIDILNILIH